MISTPTGGYTIKILNLFTLPSQAPHHAKLITIKEAETLISTSEISDAQKQHLYWLSPANLHLYLGKFRLHHACSMLGPLTATTYFLDLWKKYWVYPSMNTYKKTYRKTVWTYRKILGLSKCRKKNRVHLPDSSMNTYLNDLLLYSGAPVYYFTTYYASSCFCSQLNR